MLARRASIIAIGTVTITDDAGGVVNSTQTVAHARRFRRGILQQDQGQPEAQELSRANTEKPGKSEIA